MTFQRRNILSAVLMAAAIALPSAAGAADTPAAGAAPSQTERNKDTVIRFYNAALNDKEPDEALKYVGGDYRQHNPMAEDGREGFRKFITWIRGDHPQSHSEIKQVFADGDYVILNVHMVRVPGERGLAIGEIFRLEGGKIVEHWDRIQSIPETAANGNGMF